jgi:hypothetical protein
MAGGEKVVDVVDSGSTGHGLQIREHRVDAGVMTTSLEPFTRLGKTTDAVAAMTDDECLLAHMGIEANGP